nr:3-oxoadipate enol-lactonase [Roseospira visakhapatnamensis]
MHYRVSGAPGLPWLVFANSLATDMRLWEPVLGRMGGRVRALTYDMRGHGLSDTPPWDAAAPWTISTLADDLLALVDHLRIDRFVLCGLSVGGLVAQDLAIRVPERLRGVVLCSTASRIGSPEVWDARLEAVRAGGMAAVVEATMERWFSPTFRATEERVAPWRNMVARTPVEGFLGVAAAIREADLTEAVGTIEGPALVVGGGLDGGTPPDTVRALAGRIPGSRLEMIPGVGHLPCVEDPDTMAVLLVDFLREIGHV